MPPPSVAGFGRGGGRGSGWCRRGRRRRFRGRRRGRRCLRRLLFLLALRLLSRLGAFGGLGDAGRRHRFGRSFFAVRDYFAQPGGAFAQRLLQLLVDPAQRIDLIADLLRRVFGPDAFAALRQLLHFVEVGGDLAGGVARQQLGAAPASAGDERHRGGGAEDEGEERCGQAAHGASLDNGIEAGFSLHLTLTSPRRGGRRGAWAVRRRRSARRRGRCRRGRGGSGPSPPRCRAPARRRAGRRRAAGRRCRG